MAKTPQYYFGKFSEDSEFLQETWEEFCENSIGRLVLSIGQGKFHEQVKFTLEMAGAWALYHEKN